MKIRHILIVLLAIWCYYEIFYDLSGVENNYELILGSVIAILPFLLGLFALSLFGYQKDSGWYKKFNLAGLIVSFVVVAIIVFLIIRNSH